MVSLQRKSISDKNLLLEKDGDKNINDLEDKQEIIGRYK
jgi:hypothetical protein